MPGWNLDLAHGSHPWEGSAFQVICVKEGAE